MMSMAKDFTKKSLQLKSVTVEKAMFTCSESTVGRCVVIKLILKSDGKAIEVGLELKSGFLNI